MRSRPPGIAPARGFPIFGAPESNADPMNGRLMISGRLLLIMAQTWLVLGALSLVYASWRLFSRALEVGMSTSHLYWIIPVFVVLGAVKARMVMRKRMQANIARLSSTTEKMWPWQIYPPQLLAFIISMVILMSILKRVFAENGLGLGCLGGVDVAVAVALAVASLEYGRPGARKTVA